MGGEIREPLRAGSQAARAAAWKPDKRSRCQGPNTVGAGKGALPGNDQQQDVQLRLHMHVDPLLSRQSDKVRVELPSRFREVPEHAGFSTGGHGMDVAQDVRLIWRYG